MATTAIYPEQLLGFQYVRFPKVGCIESQNEWTLKLWITQPLKNMGWARPFDTLRLNLDLMFILHGYHNGPL